MPAPSSALSTLRPDLAQSLQDFDLAMDQNGFIALQVCPVLEVDTASGNFGQIPVEQLLQTRDTERAPGSGYTRGKWTFKNATYATVEHGAEEPIDDNEAKMHRRYFDVEMISAARAYDAVMRGLETRVAAIFEDTATYTGSSLTTTVANAWSDHVNATPLDDVEAAVRKVYANTGMWPTSLVCTRTTFRNLRLCSQIIDRLKYSGFVDIRASKITPAILASVFDLDEVIVAGSTKNSANEGQTASLGSLWNNSMAHVCRIDRSIDVRRPTVARCFHWGEDGSTIGGTVETYRDERIRGEVVRVRNQTHEKRLLTGAQHLLQGVY